MLSAECAQPVAAGKKRVWRRAGRRSASRKMGNASRFRVGWRCVEELFGLDVSHVEWRRDCDRLPAGPFDIRLVFRGRGGLFCLAQREGLFRYGAGRGVSSNDSTHSRP